LNKREREIQEKIQAQVLDNMKQIQAVQLSTLHTVREVVAALPSPTNLPSVPVIEGFPTIAQITDLNTSFATQLLDQGKAYTSQLAEVFSPAVNPSSN
jgi:hypothetical protein